jgi:hypothetical protein
MVLPNNESMTPDWTRSIEAELIRAGIPSAAFRGPLPEDDEELAGELIKDCYYHHPSRSFYRKDNRGHSIPVAGDSLREYLSHKDLPVTKEQRTGYLGALILKIQTEQNVDYAGGLAGHRPGMITLPDGRRILVTTDAPPVIPRSGECSTIDRFLDELLKESRIYLDILLNQFLTDLLRVRQLGSFAANPYPVPILALVGPSSAGKSLLVQLIKKLAGGRVGHPLQYLTGKPAFNYDLVEAEVQVADDEAASKDYRDRRTLTAQLKTLGFSGEVRCHPKGGKPVTLRPFQIFLFLTNDEPENMQVLPLIDESMVGKIMLLKAHRSDTANAAGTKVERDAFMRTLEAELPAYLEHLLTMDVRKNCATPGRESIATLIRTSSNLCESFLRKITFSKQSTCFLSLRTPVSFRLFVKKGRPTTSASKSRAKRRRSDFANSSGAAVW